MFEENGRTNTNLENGNKEIKTEKKAVCSKCGKKFILESVEFGERSICDNCRKSV